MPTPTPQAISALLRKAGFEKSESSGSKGWRNYSEGYKVNGPFDEAVEVRHMTGLDRGENGRKRRAEMLARYAAAITEAGWAIAADDDRDYVLIVTTPPSGSGEGGPSENRERQQ
jgi:hypothetical protein